jgi:LPXTG-motif cell wall-anchored protein
MRRLRVTLLTTGLLLATLAPASADDQMGLSRDGKQWTDTLTEPLFDSESLWVPGDSSTVSFYVRNQAGTGASLTISVRTNSGHEVLADDNIVLRARSGGRWITLRNGRPSLELTDASIRTGAAVKVDVQAAFDVESSNAFQAERLDLTFEVRLADAVVGADAAPESTASHDDSAGFAGWLPDTGSSTPVILIWMAGIAMAAGAALAVAGRRDREHEHA